MMDAMQPTEFLALGFCSNDHIAVLPFIPHDTKVRMISHAIFSIGAVKGIEFGNGFASAGMKGSENNDPFLVQDGRIVTRTNHHGGILGGLSSGMPIVVRTAMKPTPSIGIKQESVDLETMENTELIVKGRHDPCIVPRAVPCIEAAVAIAVYDALLEWRS